MTVLQRLFGTVPQHCRVVTRCGPCTFGQSVFNSVIQAADGNNAVAVTSINAAAGSPDGKSKEGQGTSKKTLIDRNQLHWDEILVNLTEEAMAKDAAVVDDETGMDETSNKNCAYGTKICLDLFNTNDLTRPPPPPPLPKTIQHRTWEAIPMGRAKNCPTLASSRRQEDPRSFDPKSIQKNSNSSKKKKNSKKKTFVSLAVVGLVMDPTGDHLLLTKRPTYMRSFPGAFVLPGGSVDDGETLCQAATREIYEETNIVVPVDGWTLESVWESVYPTSSLLGPISAHHIVCYLSGRALLPDGDEESDDNCVNGRLSVERRRRLPTMRLCDDEVDGAVWLSRDDMEWIIQASSSKSSDTFDFYKPQQQQQDQRIVDLICTKTDRRTGSVTTTSVPISLSDASGIYPTVNDDGSVCGMAQGSLFALERFCSKE
mmetsp:Transcript_59384/g.145285  ORF Transcript_59384/g.145285 Transcript_59384/m.145285 type:complete len:429 (-) Transcript_59384:5479-6765(-)